MRVFISLITILNKVNDTYNIYDMGAHIRIRKKIKDSYKSFRIQELNYEPAIFDSGLSIFVWVRQKYSGLYNLSKLIENKLREYKFNKF